LAAYRATGGELWRARHLALLAEALAKGGQPAEGLAVVAEALDWAHANGGRYYEAELYRLKGQLTLQLGQLVDHSERPNPQHAVSGRQSETEAEACFRRAIEIARQQSAKSWELRATTSLARLLVAQSRRDEARSMLAEIYNWFTEGFDTIDLKGAKALLDELS
jgi:predicted ATPase